VAGENILIVDDDRNILQVMEMRLRIMGYQVEVCDNPVEALSLFDKGSFSAVLTDQRMEGLRGIDLVKELHGRDAYLPVIVMTAYATVEDAVESVRQGAFTYLQKPVDANELLINLQKALEKRKFEQGLAREREIWIEALGSLGAGLVLLNSERDIVWINPIAQELLSPEGDCVGRSCCEVASQPGPLPCPHCPVEAALSSGRVQTVEHNDPLSRRWLLVTATPVKDHSGTNVKVVVLILDITEIKRSQELLLEQERLQGVLEMAGATAHELSQPMQAILGWGEILKNRLRKEDPNFCALDAICRQIERLAQLTSEISNVTRYVTRDYPGTTGIIDLNQASAENSPRRSLRSQPRKKKAGQ